MGRAAFALCVASLLLAATADRTTTSRLVSVTVGETVTLDCFYEETNAMMLFWFKQSLGRSPKMLSKLYKHDKKGIFSDEYRNESRFRLETAQNQNHLTISNVQLSDSATYHCITGYLYIYEFRESITVSVRGSGSKIAAVVNQWPPEITGPADGTSLNCIVHLGTCDEEHSIYWFKNSEDSRPALIYAQGQCERTHANHTCYYNLSVESLSDHGTFYCAVVSCGRIVFGQGTKLGSGGEVDPPLVLVYVLGVALAFTTILAVWLANAVHRANGRQRSDSGGGAATAAASNVEDHNDGDGLHYAALMVPRLSRAGGQRHGDPRSECVYTSVKHSH